MGISDSAPWKWGRKKLLGDRDDTHPIDVLQRQMNSLFEDFLTGFGFESVGGKSFTPRMNVTEDGEKIYISAELPGMDEGDVEVTLTKDTLSVRGEKKEEHEEKEGKNRYHTERSYGYFQRVIPLTCEIDEDKVDALFKKGVLSITLHKTKAAQAEAKKIPIHS